MTVRKIRKSCLSYPVSTHSTMEPYCNGIHGWTCCIPSVQSLCVICGKGSPELHAIPSHHLQLSKANFTTSSPTKKKKSKARTLTVNTKQHALSESKEKRSNDEKVCPYCKGNHYLPNCEQFQAKDQEEKTSYIREAKRCFGCLRTGHFPHACPDRHKCRTCHRSHPTVLHGEFETSSPTKQSQTSNQAETQQKANALSACTGSSNTTNVIPVWISTKENPQVEKLVYALLDTQSDSSFIEENLCSQLDAVTEHCKLKVTTLLSKDVTVECQKSKQSQG